jgi:hypothetical protein
LLHRNPWLVRGTTGQLGAAARPDPDRQSGTRLSEIAPVDREMLASIRL